MKTKNFLHLAGAVLLALTGCIPVALHPFYSEKDLVFDPSLVGVWGEKESDTNHWAFTKAQDQSYDLVITSDGKSARFDAHLLKLGTNLFLDIFPNETSFKESSLNDVYAIHLVPVHSLARVTEIGRTLNLAFMDPDWLKKTLQQDPGLIRHEKTSAPHDQLVLTASTRELQGFVLKYLNEAFDSKPDGLKRIVSKP